MQIKVSVLVYVRNDSTHIKECLDSVINQTLKEIEILAIDGGSTDGTLEVLEKMAQKDTRIRIFHTIPSVGAQFNLGVREARGEYIGICESDDYILPEMYEIQYKCAKENRLDILKADFNRFCGSGEDRIVLPFNVLDGNSLYEKIFRPRDGDYMIKMGIISFWSGLYRRKFLLDKEIFMNETGGAAYQDVSLAFLSLYKADRVMFMRKAFYCYRWDNPNSSVNSPKKAETLVEEYRCLKERLKKDGLFEACKGYYFLWKINDLVWYYSVLPSEWRKDYLPLLHSEICNDFEAGMFPKDKTLPPAVCKAELSMEALEKYLCDKQEQIWQIRQRLEQFRKDEQIIVFGNGNMGKLVRKFLQRKEIEITAYMDNNKQLWGQMDGNIPIVAPEDGVREYADAVYIVANVNYYKEMVQQLLSLGISEEKMVTCLDYDSLLF